MRDRIGWGVRRGVLVGWTGGLMWCETRCCERGKRSGVWCSILFMSYHIMILVILLSLRVLFQFFSPSLHDHHHAPPPISKHLLAFFLICITLTIQLFHLEPFQFPNSSPHFQSIFISRLISSPFITFTLLIFV